MNRIKAENILLSAKSIAVVRTDRLGDMILTLPMFNILREINPNAKLSLIARSYTEPLFKGISQIDNYFLADNKFEYSKVINENNFDVLFFPMMKFEEVLPAFKKKIKLRIGSGYRLYSSLLNYKIYHHRKEGKKNEAEYNLELISDITKANYSPKLISPIVHKPLPIRITEELKDCKFIIIHPGGAGSAPRWNSDNFGKLAKLISEKFEYIIILSGSDSEKADCERVFKYGKNCFLNLCGQLNLDEMITLISKSEVLISNSTGVLHIAASFNKKILGFFPNSPAISQQRWGPICDKKMIITPEYANNIDMDNMDLITVDNAFQGFSEFNSK